MKFSAFDILTCFIFICLNFYPENDVKAQQKTDTARFMVATAHPIATKAGMEILKQGGNAFDAITASSFVLAVVEPSMSGIGGRLQAIFQKSNGEIGGVDATTQVPFQYKPKAKEEENGFGTIGVPGMVKGILELHTKYGKLPLKKVMAPAILTAKNGFPILREESLRFYSVLSELKKYASTRENFLIKDTIPKNGDLFKQAILANTLQKIARDKGHSFYKGKLAQNLTEQITLGGGSLSFEDMQRYEAENGKILKGNYRGFEIMALGMPSYGAIAIEMLHLLEHENLSTTSEFEFLMHHANAHKKAYEDRKLLKTNEDLLVEKSYALSRWTDSSKTIVSKPEDARNGHTTHLVASDSMGNIVSVTQSLGPIMGSKVASENGYMLATTMGPYLGSMKAGERASSHIAPVLVLKNGIPILALGAAGGARIVPAVVQVISRFIDQKMSLEQAVAAARIFHLGDRIQIENHDQVYWKESTTLQSFQKQKILYTEIKQPAQFGRVHAIQRLPSGLWIGAADPDWTGSAGNY